MNNTNIEWTHIFGQGTGMTWNAVSGCFHQCRYEYCYNTMKSTSPLNRFGAKYLDSKGLPAYEKDWEKRQKGQCHIAKKGEVYPYGYDPTFYPHRLNEPAKVRAPRGVFVVDTGDLFGEWVDKAWIDAILDEIAVNPQHIFFLLTKNPRRLLDFHFPDNAWVGTTICSNEDARKIKSISEVDAKVKFLSCEPLHGAIEADLKAIDWVIIGAETGQNANQPRKEWVEQLVASARKVGAAVFFKSNLVWPDAPKEFPYVERCKCGGTYVPFRDTWPSRLRCNLCGQVCDGNVWMANRTKNVVNE